MRGRMGCGIAVVAGLAMMCGRARAQELQLRPPSDMPSASWPGGVQVHQGGQVLLVTLASPDKKQSCRVASFDEEKIECARHGGKTVAYQRSAIAALIAPAERSHWLYYFVGFLGGSGGAFWGSVVLAPVCIPCSVVLAVTGTLLLIVSPAFAMASDGDYPEHAIYLKEGETLQVKLR